MILFVWHLCDKLTRVTYANESGYLDFPWFTESDAEPSLRWLLAALEDNSAIVSRLVLTVAKVVPRSILR